MCQCVMRRALTRGKYYPISIDIRNEDSSVHFNLFEPKYGNP